MKKIINYSGIPVLVLIATLAFMPFSCSKEAVKENPLTDNSSQLIKISGEDANAATKTILVNFATLWIRGDDQVGVYCPEAQEENGQENIPYTASSTAFSSAFTGAMKWGGTGKHHFYAYYPYSVSAGANTTVVPITLYADQSQSAGNSSSHIGNYDFMVATPTDVTPGTAEGATTVNLRYNHVFTILEFQIKGTGTLYAVSLTVPITDPPSSPPIAFSDYNSYTIDITQTPEIGDAYIIVKSGVEPEINEVIVTLLDNNDNSNPATLSPTTATSVYMVINPGTQTGTCIIGLDIDLDDGAGETWTYISKAASVDDGGFLRGKKYVVPVDAATVLGAPTIGTATAGDAQAEITFTVPESDGGSAITGYTVTSNPGGNTGTGSASPIIVTGLTNLTAYTFTVTATYDIGTGTKSAPSNSVIPGTVTSLGNIWMDRNLGATQVATASDDYLAYGSLYQWGRLSNGHQLINWISSTGSDGAEQTNEISDLSSGDVPSDGKFILAPTSLFDWLSTQNDNLWLGVDGVNNPCPSGFRIPTEAEFNAEITSWGSSNNNAVGAFNSPLKFTVAGDRANSDGSLNDVGSNGNYWSSTVDGTSSRHLYFYSSGADMGSSYRANGFSVRCIKDY